VRKYVQRGPEPQRPSRAATPQNPILDAIKRSLGD
jgi:hypothetical protein